jgi:hypothetical protein
MTLFDVTDVTAHLACRVAPRLFPWFCPDAWLAAFADDAKVLRHVAAELARAEAWRSEPAAAQCVEHTVFYAAFALGERQYHGLAERWPRWILRRLTEAGLRADATLWQAGCENGYHDADLFYRQAGAADYPE